MNTNDLAQLVEQWRGWASSAPAGAAANWHGLTVWHALALTIVSWVTHANWDRVLAAQQWIDDRGGLGRIACRLIWVKSPPAPRSACPPAAAAAPQPSPLPPAASAAEGANQPKP